MATFKFNDNIKIVNSKIVFGSEPYLFWQTPNTSGYSLSGLSVTTASSLNTRIDWGDRSATERITPGTKYNHTFI